MANFFDTLATDTTIEGPSFPVSRESIRTFCEASLDFNPLHLDDNYMQGSFGRTSFGGIIMHGMNNFGLISRMLTDWAFENGGVHRRLETRWLKPVKPGDTIRPHGQIKGTLKTAKSRWATVSVEVKNQRNETVATGEAMVEFPQTVAG
jgi:3-hydroxybutyryl-CoA dehydratase